MQGTLNTNNSGVSPASALGSLFAEVNRRLRCPLLNLPEEMRARKQWACTFGEGKEPRTPVGALAKSNDSSTWSEFAVCLDAVQSGRASGLGYVLAADDPFTVIDIDLKGEKRTSENVKRAEGLIDYFDSYTEISRSGLGYHVVLVGKKPDASPSKRDCFEVYDRNRFIICTGRVLGGGESFLEPATKQIADICQWLAHGPGQPLSGTQAGVEHVDSKTVGELRSALLFMRSDDRDLWQRMGHALKSLGDVGRGLWLEWSATSEKFNPGPDARTWESFNPTHTGFQAVFAEAQRRGWVNPMAGKVMTSAPALAVPVEPVDIFREFAAKPLNPNDFPSPIGRYAELHGRATGHDQQAYLMAFTAVCAAAISDTVQVELSAKTNWYQSARLWVLLLGAPSAAKSPAIKEAMEPVYAIDKERHERWQREVAEWKARKEANEGPLGPFPPDPSVVTSDATGEAISKLLGGHNHGILVCNDEFEAWLGQHDAYRSKGAASKDRGDWCRLFDGGHSHIHRKSSDEPLIENYGASILTATTPRTLQKLAKHLPEDGLVQRFIAVRIRPRVEEDETVASGDLTLARSNFAVCVRNLFGTSEDLEARGKRSVLLSADATTAFKLRCRQFRDDVQTVYGVLPPLAGHIGKLDAIVARLALTFHAVGHPGDFLTREISGACMESAIRVVDCLISHAWGLYSELTGGKSHFDLAKAVGRSILADKLTAPRRTDLMKSCSALEGADDRAREATLTLLEDCGWLVPGRFYGNRTATWTVNPRVHDLFGEQGEQHLKVRAKVKQLIVHRI